ncbi:MAG: hypothetical protein H6569_14645 [Lewinellaceae bacterium]|nr:hypothetical protein [Lewinellaceae bacterium]
MKTLLALAWFGTLLLLCQTVAAQPELVLEPELDNIFSRLQQYEPLNVIIETDLKRLRKERNNEKWQPAMFKIMVGDSVAFEKAVKVATRGNMRKKTCDFPPVKIRFFEEKPYNDSIADINQLKLVVNCRYSEADEQLVVLEYLAYELYNLLTEESFRVKSASVQFVTPGRKRPDMDGKAFFIESEKEMASRLGGRPLKPRIITPRIMDSVSFARMSVFQYMIGNTDWGVYTRHNLKVVGTAESKVIPVPYDFDYAGLVAADYAVPSPDIKVNSVRERYFLGMCQSAELYQQVIDEFLAKKEQILAHCENAHDLNYGSRKDALYYLNEFFSILEDPEKVKKELLENCNRRVRSD